MKKNLKNQWVRNRVLEIRRFTEAKDRYYVKSKNMIADFGTTGGKSVDVGKSPE